MAQRKPSSEYFDIRGLLQGYVSHWYLFVLSVIICVAAGFMYTRINKPLYGVRANISINTGNENPISTLGAMGALFGDGGYIEDEIFVISSHTVYRSVARALQTEVSHYVRDGFMDSHFAYKDYPVQVFMNPELPDTLSTSLSFVVKVNDKEKVSITGKADREKIADIKDATFPVTLETTFGKFVFNKTDHFVKGKDLKTTILITSYDSAAETLAKNVNCEMASRKSNVIEMSINTPNPEYGMDILNEIMAEYNKKGVDQKNLQGEKTAEFLETRLKLLAGDLDTAEGDIQNYKQKEGIVDLEVEAKYQSQKKGEVEAQLIEAQTEAEILKMIRDFISEPSNSNSLIPMTTSTEGLETAIRTYNELIMKRMELASNARSNNTALRLLDEQIAAMRSNINTSLSKAYDTQRIAVKELESAKRAADTRLGNIPSQERAFRDMLRQQTIKENLYVFLLERREENAILLANAVPKGTIIDEAYTLIDPLSMGKKMILLIAFFIGLLLPPIYLWLKNFLNDKFTSVSEVKRLTDAPILGEICTDKSGRNLVVTPTDTSSTTELFRLLRSNLQFIMGGKNDKVVLMTSTSSGEGKSFVSVNLAATLALLGKKVVLIGMDIRKPRLASYLNLHPQFGLTQYLSSEDLQIKQIITPLKEIEGMDVIVAGPVPPNPSELLTSQKIDAMFQTLRSMYDYIIVDSAPVGMVSDTFALDRISDATIYVCRANFTGKQDIDFINEIYDTKRLKKLSIVVNGTESRKGYGYGYRSTKKNIY
ncbi:MAG: polysaccharide biosynthesis tyrosine autokinase [Muribaculaceae bacterium]|nr:polysaccharide biosynthesis tyrosine autokinase [Muribaculaceae bacterium]